MKEPAYRLEPCGLATVAELVERYHGYGSMGTHATYAFAVFEGDRAVAAYAWQPPPVGAAKAVCPEAPQGVLALSRMVAVPKAERRLQHVSRPLRRQMVRLIDRGRWPVLVTYSDEGQGHTGHVYKCSGWQSTVRSKRPYFLGPDGERVSSYANGKHGRRALQPGGHTWVQRWEHRVCDVGGAADWMTAHGWVRVPVPGRKWASGNQAYTYRLEDS